MTKKCIYVSALAVALAISVYPAKAEDVSITQAGNAVSAAAESIKEQSEGNEAFTITPARNPLSARVKVLKTNYLVAPGDSIAISIYGEPDLMQEDILVRPDGFATIEPFGELAVAGYSVGELTNLVKEKLGEYLIDPRVSIKLNTMHAVKVYIRGAVQRPGLYEPNVDNGRTVSETRHYSEPTVASVISNAGGINFNADLKNVRITNNETGRDETVNLMKMLTEGDVNQDVYLSSGDCVYIPELSSEAQIHDKEFLLVASSSIAPLDFPVKVIGSVFRPGVYNIKSNNPGINSALAFSEGFTPDANRRTVTIQRVTPQGNISQIHVNPMKTDIVLRPNDTIVVNDASVSSVARFTRFIADIIEPVRRASDSTNTWLEVFDPTRRYRNLR